MKVKYNDWHLFTYLTKYIRPYLWLLILASIALISNLLSSLIRPYLSKQVIDLGFAMKDLNTIQHYAGLYALTIVGSIVFILLQNYLLSTFGRRLFFIYVVRYLKKFFINPQKIFSLYLSGIG